AAAPVTVTFPAPIVGSAWSALWMFAAVYAWLWPPITGVLKLMKLSWNGAVYVAVPAPEFARPAVGFWTVNGRRPVTESAVNVPLYPVTPAPEMTTMSPTERLCAAAVRTVTVFPDSLRPGAFSVIVPPPERGRPVVGFVYVNERVDGTVSTVNVPL